MAVSMTDEETFRFIELYQGENCLWNPKNKNHKNKNIINDSWKRIADTMGVPPHELKKKKESLMTYFRSNLKKKLSSLKSGSGGEDEFKPMWQFYDAMEVFLRDVYESKSICNSEGNTQGMVKDKGIDKLDDGSTSSSITTEVQLENSNPITNSKMALKRRANNPPELQEASKQMSTAFTTLNSMLQNKKNKEDKENDDADLFCKLLAKQLKDFPKDEREEIMYEIHGLILDKRRRCRDRVLQPSISPSIYDRSSSAHSFTYSKNESPRNIISPEQLIVQQPSLYVDTHPSQIVINRPSSSRSSYNITTPPQNFNKQRSHQTLPVINQQPTLYCYTSPPHRPSSSRSSYMTPTPPQNFEQEISHESPFISNNVQILSQETIQPETNILLEAFEKATTEQN